jgi:hypothetical protein
MSQFAKTGAAKPHLNPTQFRTTRVFDIGSLGWNLKLSDSSGQRVRLPVLPVGSFVYNGNLIDIRLEDVATIRAETLRLFDTIDSKVIGGATSWRPPIIREHEPDGSNDGRVVDFQSDEFGLWAVVEFNDATWGEIKRNEVQWFSPKVVSGYVDQWGNTYEKVILEVSLTSNPKLKHIGRVQDYIQLSEGLIMENEETQLEAPAEASEDLAARVAALEEVVAILAEKLAALDLADEEEAPAPAPEEEVALADSADEGLKALILALSDKVDAIGKSRGVRFKTVVKGNAGPSPAPKNLEAELRAQGLKGGDLAAKLAGWE